MGPIWSPIQSFLASSHHHLAACRKQCPERVALLENAFYIGDLTVGLPSVDKRATAYSEAHKIFSKASMELRKWASSSDALQKRFLCNNVPIENEARNSAVIKAQGML